jgi:hypothetical protein
VEAVVSRATRCVRFGTLPGGQVTVSASPGYRALSEFLETDIGGELSELRFVAERARRAEDLPWGFGGDSCHVTVAPEDVLVENDFTGEQVVLPRAEFVRILDDYADAVVAARTAAGRSSGG